MNFSQERPFLLVGAGKMGGAMLSGWMADGFDPASIVVQDPSLSDDMRDLLETHGISCLSSPSTDLRPGVVMVAVKPQLMDVVLPGLREAVSSDTLIMSVAAGTPVATFENNFGSVPICRCMPNTPAMVKRGVTAVYPTSNVSEEHKRLVDRLLSAIGKVVWLEQENQIDFVTAVSGSGPAYVFYLAEALAKAGYRLGLPEDLALELAVSTVTGAGELMHQSGDAPSQLRQNVTSPNGTTAAALDVLMGDAGLQPVLDAAVLAAARRAKELA